MLIPRAFCADKPGNKMPLPRPPRRPPPSLRLPPARLAAAVQVFRLGPALGDASLIGAPAHAPAPMAEVADLRVGALALS